MSRTNRIRIKNPYPLRGAERDALIKVVAANFGEIIVSWHTEWYPAQPGDERQVAVDHIVFKGTQVLGRVRITVFLLSMMQYHILLHHEPHRFRTPREVPPDKEDTSYPEEA
jgi:hypothetical protein